MKERCEIVTITVNHVILLHIINFQLNISIYKILLFRKYVPAVKTMNQWMKKMAVTQVEFFSNEKELITQVSQVEIPYINLQNNNFTKKKMHLHQDWFFYIIWNPINKILQLLKHRLTLVLCSGQQMSLKMD